jgi:hypothetical protein
LVDNLVGCQIGGKALLAGHTEFAVHLTAHLRGDTKRSPVFVGYIDSFHEMPLACPVQVFHRTVYRAHGIYRRFGTYLIDFFQQFPMLQRKIAHFVYRNHLLVIQPGSYLLGRETGHSQILHHILQFRERQAQ